MARNFNQKEAEILLAEIKEFPAIYDPGDKTYNDFSVKGKVWLYIADKVGKNAVDCRKKWKNLKDSYMKYRKRPETADKWPMFKHLMFLEDAIKNRKKHIKPHNSYEIKKNKSDNNIEFDKIIKNNEMHTNVDEITSTEKLIKRQLEVDERNESQSDGASSDVSVSQLTISKKQRLRTKTEWQPSTIENTICLYEDDVDLFLKSIAITLKTLPPQVVSQAKLKILSIVNELQFP